MKLGLTALLMTLTMTACAGNARTTTPAPDSGRESKKQEVLIVGNNDYFQGFTVYLTDQAGNTFSGRACEVRNIGTYSFRVSASLFENRIVYFTVIAFASG